MAARRTTSVGWGVRPVSTLVAAVAVSTGGMLPATLVGALAVQMRRDLRFSNAGLGLAIGVFFLASALGSVGAGRWNDRMGARPTLLVGAVSSAACLAGIAGLARSFALLLPLLLVGAVAAAVSTPATNALVAANVPAARQGAAHGAKQAAIPLSGMLAGLAVPSLALTVGWRWAFAVAVLVPLAGGFAALLAATPARARGGPRPPFAVGGLTPAERRPLLWIAVGAGLAAAAVTSLNSFVVVACTDAGMSEGAAGLVAAVASGVVIVVRLAAGHLADRRPGDRLGAVALMLSASFAGYALLATGAPSAMAAGAVLGLAVGWGWPGLLTLAVVELHDRRPGAATGVAMTGIYVGAVVGPLLVGLLEETTSFTIAWVVAGLLAQAAAVTMLVGRGRYRHAGLAQASGSASSTPSDRGAPDR